MKTTETHIPGCIEIHPRVIRDPRGRFVKTFQREAFSALGLATDYCETYYSVSRRGVLRGLHFQLPPYDLCKLVYCSEGHVLDAVVDLRAGSPSYGCHVLVPLCARLATMLYIPKGLAHGFYVVSPKATVVYHTTASYSAEHDGGILWNSAGIPWPTSNPLLSERDGRFPPLAEFVTPFAFHETHA